MAASSPRRPPRSTTRLLRRPASRPARCPNGRRPPQAVAPVGLGLGRQNRSLNNRGYRPAGSRSPISNPSSAVVAPSWANPPNPKLCTTGAVPSSITWILHGRVRLIVFAHRNDRGPSNNHTGVPPRSSHPSQVRREKPMIHELSSATFSDHRRSQHVIPRCQPRPLGRTEHTPRRSARVAQTVSQPYRPSAQRWRERSP